MRHHRVGQRVEREPLHRGALRRLDDPRLAGPGAGGEEEVDALVDRQVVRRTLHRGEELQLEVGDVDLLGRLPPRRHLGGLAALDVAGGGRGPVLVHVAGAAPQLEQHLGAGCRGVAQEEDVRRRDHHEALGACVVRIARTVTSADVVVLAVESVERVLGLLGAAHRSCRRTCRRSCRRPSRQPCRGRPRSCRPGCRRRPQLVLRIVEEAPRETPCCYRSAATGRVAPTQPLDLLEQTAPMEPASPAPRSSRSSGRRPRARPAVTRPRGAARRRGRQHRRDAALPRHGHRYGEASARRTARHPAPPARPADGPRTRDRGGVPGLGADGHRRPARRREAAGAGRRFGALHPRGAGPVRVPGHRPAAAREMGGRARRTRSRRRCMPSWPSATPRLRPGSRPTTADGSCGRWRSSS